MITAKNYKVSPDKKKIKNLYHTAFPKEERLPWWLLRLWNGSGLADITAYYEADTFCGFTFSASRGEILFVVFFAVADGLRGQGYGSAILSYLKEENPEKTILLNVELLDKNAENNPQRIRRMAFYKKNGIYDSGYNVREVGGAFRVLGSKPEWAPRAFRRVYQKLSFGLWRPPITWVGKYE